MRLNRKPFTPARWRRFVRRCALDLFTNDFSSGRPVVGRPYRGCVAGATAALFDLRPRPGGGAGR